MKYFEDEVDLSNFFNDLANSRAGRILFPFSVIDFSNVSDSSRTSDVETMPQKIKGADNTRWQKTIHYTEK